jgi:MFS family permease
MGSDSTDSVKLGPIYLSPGVTVRNALTYWYAAFFTIGLVAAVGFMQPYLLSENLGLPISQEGRASSILQLGYEVVVLLAVGPLGALADRIGRRPIFVLGFCWISASFVLFPLVESFAQLFAVRVFFGVGSACCTCMMATVLADYPLNRSRGLMIAATGVCNGLGALFMIVLLSQLPDIFAGMGFETLMSGRLTYWLGSVLAVITALVVWRGLKAGKPGVPQPRKPLANLLREGIGAARGNPRILVTCAEAFAARGDLVVFSTFFSLWARQAGIEQGLTLETAIAAAGKFAAIVSLSQLLWAPVWGWVLDRFDRVTVLAMAMLLAATAYIWVGFSADPLAAAFIPAAILLGIGEGSAILSGAGVIGQEAPEDIRGSVLGLFNFAGSLGILTISLVGGFLFDAWMPGAPFVVVGLINGAIMVLAIWVRWRYGYRDPSGAGRPA